MQKLIIGVTDCSKYDNYSKWMLSYAANIEVIRLSEKLKNYQDATRCHGILFTGGEDVHPRFYAMPEYLSYCHKDDVNEKRDEFELQLMEYTEENHIPVLGICRGLQLFNVFKGGTLIPDLPSWKKKGHSKLSDGSDAYHSITLREGSQLLEIIGTKTSDINSNHHQSADKIGDGLIISAEAADGTVEGIERIQIEEKPYLCLVQWHPERMKPATSPFVENIRSSFINAAIHYSKY